MREKILNLLQHLNQGLVDREAATKAALLTILAGENIVLIGPPGTAKSLVARRIAKALSTDALHADYFEYLLTKFSTPEELFGPLSIAELKADRFVRNTSGYLPSVRVAFLDEIFKASSSILNALLTILNERKYHNGARTEDVPLLGLVAASNELPTGQEELSALYDRFLVRSFVDYVGLDQLPLLFTQADEPALPDGCRISSEGIDALRREAGEVSLPPEVAEAVQTVWRRHREVFKEDPRETLSDRRLKKVVKLLRIAAASNGRKEADLSDVLLLKDCLWSHPDNISKVREIIITTLRRFSHAVPLKPIDLSKRSSPLPMPARGQTGTVIGGFKGSGTASDPLLIATMEDLLHLDLPDVGQRGHHFRQVADISCAELTHLHDIVFKGHFDGGGHTITGPDRKPETGSFLFKEVQPGSRIFGVNLENFSLASAAHGCSIEQCASNVPLLAMAGKSTIHACESDSHLISAKAVDCKLTSCLAKLSIAHSAENCMISHCQTGWPLISEQAINCNIADCLVELNYTLKSDRNLEVGGVTSALRGGSCERCVVTGSISSGSNYEIELSGIAHRVEKASIKDCALSHLALGRHATLGRRIAFDIKADAKLVNNVALDGHPGKSSAEGEDGKTIAAALMAQRYFENALNWNFQDVWRWDAESHRPALRTVGVAASFMAGPPADSSGPCEDLLEQQCRANIWL